MTGQLREIGAETLESGLSQGRILVVDVREPDEYAREHIAGAVSLPLSRFDATPLPEAQGKMVVLHCNSGARSVKAAQILFGRGAAEATHLKGGIAAWKQAGLPVQTGKGPLPIMRQVQIAAGSMALLGVVLGFAAHPGFFALSGAVGAGLLISGVSGSCMMANLLMKLPYNRA